MRLLKVLQVLTLFVLISLFIVFIFYSFYFGERFYPKTIIAGVDVSYLKKKEAESVLRNLLDYPPKIILTTKNQNFEIDLNELSPKINIEKSVEAAFSKTHPANIFYNALISLSWKKTFFPLDLSIDEKKLTEFLNIISNDISDPPVYPEVYLLDDQIKVERGKAGEIVDKELLSLELKKKISNQDFSPLNIPYRKIDPTINLQQEDVLRKRAGILLNKEIRLKSDNLELKLKPPTLLSFLDVKTKVNEDRILNFIKENVSAKINQEPQNAVFKHQGKRVLEFKPALDGFLVDEKFLVKAIENALDELEKTPSESVEVVIKIDKKSPSITIESVNNLGIEELLGRGESLFAGSIASRIHNIETASKRISGNLVAPGETFSFNEALGEVSSLTGYQKAYIIKDGKTILGDGGGVCQVSTTLFRAVLNSGLPIIERSPHSYRVYYYEQDSPPGLDATVFAPTTDFKFINDTPSHILIQSSVDLKKNKIVFEIYGKKDGRTVSISKPKILSQTPPPEDLYIDDPTLPLGTIKQIEHKAWGAVVSFDYKVENNGILIFQKTFISKYRPWQAVFLRGTKI